MSTDHAWNNIRERLVVRRPRLPSSVRYMLFGALATLAATVIPMLFAIFAIGMSRQDGDVVFNGALAAWVAMCAGFLTIRRLLRVPLLRAYGYVAITFVTSFLAIAIILKFLRINFSS